MPVKSLPGNVMKKLLLAAEQRKANAWQCQEENWMLGWGKWETALCALRFIANISFLFLIIQHRDEPQPQNVFGTRGQLIYFHLNQKHDPGTVYMSSDGVLDAAPAQQQRNAEQGVLHQLLATAPCFDLGKLSSTWHQKWNIKKSRDMCWRKGCTPLHGGNLLVLTLGESALCSRGRVSTFFQKVSPTG